MCVMKDTAKDTVLGYYSMMLKMNEPPNTCTGFVPFIRIRHSDLQTPNIAVMLLRLNGPYPILWMVVQ